MRPEPGREPPRTRTTLFETKTLPRSAGISCWSSLETVSLSPAGERSLSRTETEATSPTRTTRESSFSSGGADSVLAGAGRIVTVAEAVATPLDTV